MRIGFASDIHQLILDRPLILAGIVIPAPYGELAHSDGDVVYHALAESILGALALGDLGEHFPDSDPTSEGMDSSLIVKHAVTLMEEKGYRVGNVDISIYLESPKLQPHKIEMRRHIAELLKTDISHVSLKAGTNEKMDAVGERKAVKADAIILLEEK